MPALLTDFAGFRVSHAPIVFRRLRLQQMAQVCMKTFRLLGTSIRECCGEVMGSRVVRDFWPNLSSLLELHSVR